jgi:hypothetical protein
MNGGDPSYRYNIAEPSRPINRSVLRTLVSSGDDAKNAPASHLPEQAVYDGSRSKCPWRSELLRIGRASCREIDDVGAHGHRMFKRAG